MTQIERINADRIGANLHHPHPISIAILIKESR